jgi:type III secretion protein J
MKLLYVSMFALLLISCKERIIHDLSEGEANRLLSHFHDQGIEVAKERLPEGSWALSVPRDQASRAIVLLDQSRLTKRSRQIAPRQGSFLASREQQQLEFSRHLANEIELTLLSIDGVYEARVHLHLPAPDPILGARRPEVGSGSASVLLVASAVISIPSLEVARIVSGASGVPTEQVAVLITEPTSLSMTHFESPIVLPASPSIFAGLNRLSFMSIVLGLAAVLAGLWALLPYLRSKMKARGKKAVSTKPSSSAIALASVDRESEPHKFQGIEAGGFRELVERAKAVSL